MIGSNLKKSTSSISAGRLLSRITYSIRSSYEADRRRQPERFLNAPDGLGPNHLFVENVARMLGCNVDHVRRIPRDALPASKIGARMIYARADVEAYISSKRDSGQGRYVSPRAPNAKKSAKAASAAEAQLQPVATFDPVAAVRRALKTP